jgi:hypothetical protein
MSTTINDPVPPRPRRAYRLRGDYLYFTRHAVAGDLGGRRFRLRPTPRWLRYEFARLLDVRPPSHGTVRLRCVTELGCASLGVPGLVVVGWRDLRRLRRRLRRLHPGTTVRQVAAHAVTWAYAQSLTATDSSEPPTIAATAAVAGCLDRAREADPRLGALVLFERGDEPRESLTNLALPRVVEFLRERLLAEPRSFPIRSPLVTTADREPRG